MPDSLTLRPIHTGDFDKICTRRVEMFRENGKPETDLAAMVQPFRQWLAPRLASGVYFGFVAEIGGQDVGTVGLLELDWPPHFMHPALDRRGYILNMYVEPAHRGRGVAKRLLATAEAEFARRGLSYIVLHASPIGQPLYEASGWTTTREMAKVLTV